MENAQSANGQISHLARSNESTYDEIVLLKTLMRFLYNTNRYYSVVTPSKCSSLASASAFVL
jgi:hypothetical protein